MFADQGDDSICSLTGQVIAVPVERLASGCHERATFPFAKRVERIDDLDPVELK